MSKRLQNLLHTPVNLPDGSGIDVELGFSTLSVESLEVEQANDNHDALLAIATGLENIANVLSEDSDTTLVNIATESLLDPTGLSTQPSVEGIKETLSKIWEGIKNAIKTVMRTLKKWWMTFTNQLPKVRKKALNLLARTNALTGDSTNRTVTVKSSLANRIAMDERVDIDLSVKTISGMARVFTKDGYAGIEAFEEAVSAIIPVMSKITTSINDFFLGKLKKSYEEIKGIFVPILIPVPGHKEFTLDKDTFTLKIVNMEGMKDIEDAVAIPTLSVADIKAHLESTIATLDVLIDSHKGLLSRIHDTESRMEKSGNAFVKGLGDLKGRVTSATDKVSKPVDAFILNRISKATATGAVGTMRILSYTASTIDANLNIIKLSIEQYKKK